MIKIVLKLSFAAVLVWWLVQSGRLDFGLVAKALTNPILIIGCLALICLQALLSSLRWKLLLEVESVKTFPLLAVARLTWIGLFFNSFLPGAVTGDLIKLVYARELDPNLSKTSLITSAFLDRIFGLVGLLSLMGIFSLVNYSNVTSISPQLTYLIHFNLFLFTGAIFFIASLFFPKKGQRIVLDLVEKVPVLGLKIQKTFEKVWLIGTHPKSVFTAIGLSMFIQFLSVFAFWMLTSPFYSTDLSLSEVFTFIPLGLIAVAIPIAPAGLGVGHLAFDTLFNYAGVTGGASLFNLFFICLLTVNLHGLIPYLLSTKTKKTQLEAPIGDNT
jgi:glycosyltransferase 2 family protein